MDKIVIAILSFLSGGFVVLAIQFTAIAIYEHRKRRDKTELGEMGKTEGEDLGTDDPK